MAGNFNESFVAGQLLVQASSDASVAGGLVYLEKELNDKYASRQFQMSPGHQNQLQFNQRMYSTYSPAYKVQQPMIPPDKMCPFSRVPTANESELAMQSNE